MPFSLQNCWRHHVTEFLRANTACVCAGLPCKGEGGTAITFENHPPLAGFRDRCVNNLHRRITPCDGKSQGRRLERWATGAGLWRGDRLQQAATLQAERTQEKVGVPGGKLQGGAQWELDCQATWGHGPWQSSQWCSMSNKTLTYEVEVITSASLVSEACSESTWNVWNPTDT